MTKMDRTLAADQGFGGITFFHTTPGHVATFGTLMTQLAPEIPVRHEVAEPLLATARHQGRVSPEIAERANQVIRTLSSNGARVIVCTCTTLASCVDPLALSDLPLARAITLENNAKASFLPSLLQRVDQAAIQQACKQADGHLTIAACLEVSLRPTLNLVEETLADMGKSLSLQTVLIPDAWALFEQGLRRDYLQTIAARIEHERPEGGVVLLNQPSMAGAERYLPNPPFHAISSPLTGVKAAIDAWRQLHPRA